MLWLCFGTINIREMGQGILINREGHIITASARENGFIERILVSQGENVKKDQLLVTLSNPMLSSKIILLKDQLTGLEQQKKLLLEQFKKEDVLQQEYFNSKQNELTNIISFQKDHLNYLTGMMKSREKIVETGGMSRLLYEEQLRLYHDIVKALNENVAQSIEIKSSKLTFNNGWQRVLLQNKIDILFKEIELKNVLMEFDRATHIFSPITGIVTDIQQSIGDNVNPGSDVINLSPTTHNLGVILFVPANRGQVIKPGMPAVIELAGIDAELYGGIKATVESASLFPSSRKAIFSILQNEEMADTFLTGNKELLMVRLKLETDEHTVSGYAWTSGKGIEREIHAGNACTGFILTRKERPIRLIIPGIKKIVGIKN